MKVQRRIGLSAQLAIIVIAGFVALQIMMMLVAWRQAAGVQERWEHPFVMRLKAVTDIVERARETSVSLTLDSVSNSETAYSIVDRPVPRGYSFDRIIKQPDPAAAPDAPISRRYVTMLKRSGVVIPALWPTPTGSIANRAITVGLKNGKFLLAEPVGQRRRRDSFALILILNLVLGTGVSLAVWRIARRLVVPVEVISRRAEGFGRDFTATPMDEAQGPAEARHLARAFNEMRRDTKYLIDERMQLLAAIAHDLRTYLTRIRLRTSAIPDLSAREAADSSIRQMAKLIDDVLFAARAEQKPLKRNLVDVPMLLQDIVEARQSINEPVELCGVDQCIALADEDALCRAFENLIGNAVAYAGGCVVDVNADCDWATISFIDRGPGIPAAIVQASTEPFIVGDASRSSGNAGIGLGLYITRTLLEQQKGKLLIAATPGGGTTVTVRLRTVGSSAPE